MGLFDRTLQSIPFVSFQTVWAKALAAIGYAVLVRSLPSSDIGAIGLTAGYLSMLAIFALVPETVFVRDFARMEKRLNEYITSFLWFGLGRDVVMFLLGIPVAGYLFLQYPTQPLWLYFLLIQFSFFAGSLAGPFREAFYASYRQARVALVDSILAVVGVGLIVFVWFTQELLVYGLVQLATSLLMAVAWYWTARTHMNFHFSLPKDWWAITWTSIKEFTLWNQTIGTVSRLLYQADIVVLGFFVTLGELGPYAVALTIANVFFVFPQLAQKLVTLSFSRVNHEQNANALGLAVKYNTLVSIGQFVGFLILGYWMVLFFGPENPGQVWEYSLYLVGGVSLFNLSRPWLAMAYAQMDNRKLFFQLFVPIGIIGIVAYALAAPLGVLAVAQANVGVYGLATLLAIGYITYVLNIRPRIEWITPQERAFVAKLGNLVVRKKA